MTNKEKPIDWSKIDSGMCQFLSDWMESPPESRKTEAIPLFIQTVPNPSKYALLVLNKLGVSTTKPASGIFTAHLNAEQIIALSHRRFIVKLTKSRKLKST